MKRRKLFTIKMVALGLAVAALAAPSAQARLDEGLGVQAQSEPGLIVSADDRAVSRMSPAPSQPIVIASDDGVEIGMLGMSGIVLLLGAGAMAWTVHHSRKGTLASV